MQLDYVFFYKEYLSAISSLAFEHGVERLYTKGSVMINPHEKISKILYIKSGMAFYTNSFRQEKSNILGIIMPTATLGCVPTFLNTIPSVGVLAAENTTVLEFHSDLLKQSCNDPALQENLFGITNRYSNLFKCLSLYNSFNIPQRLALFIRSYVTFFNVSIENNFYPFHLKLSHQQLAQIIGVNRVTMSLLLGYLKKIDNLKMFSGVMHFNKIFISDNYIKTNLGDKKWENIRKLSLTKL